MARVTVEDCILKVPNRFDLVLLAAQRARELSSGATTTLERENDKNPVIALREIAEETIDIDELREKLIFSLQKHVEIDEPEDDSMSILAAAEKEWAGISGDDATAAAPPSAPVAETTPVAETAPDETVPDEEVPVEAAPDEETPIEAAPAETGADEAGADEAGAKTDEA